MPFVKSAAMLILLLGLVACAHTPRPSGYSYSTEKNLQSVHHWEVLAQKVVKTQVLPIATTNNPETGSVISNPIYIDNSDQTEFGKAFYDYIITDLSKHGIRPASDSYGATQVKWGTQLVWHDKEGWSFPGVFGVVLGAIKWILVGDASPPSSDIEVIVITQVESEQIILSRQSHNFYINEGNEMNFRKPEKVSGATVTMSMP